MATSIFRTTGRRPTLQAVGAAGFIRDVYTEDEFRTALTEFDARSTGSTTPQGFGVRIMAPITAGSPFVIPSSLPGFVIEGNNITITPTAAMAEVFMIKAFFVTISRVYVQTLVAANAPDAMVVCDPTSTTTGGILQESRIVGSKALIQIASGAGHAGWSVINNQYLAAYATSLGSSVSLLASDGHFVTGNTIVATGAVNAIEVNGGNCRIANNDTNNDAIVVGASGGTSTVSGNIMQGGAITTSASSGKNTVFGNTNCGALTTLATDAVGLNT